MPKKAKEKTEELNIKPVSKKSTSKKSNKNDATKKEKVASKSKVTAKKKVDSTKKATAKKEVASTKRATAKKKLDSEKEVLVKEKTNSKKESTTKKKVNSSKATTTRKKVDSAKIAKTKKKTSTKKTVKTVSTAMEYYDLPFRYNQTVVKILAQTPNVLFIYWDISDNDRKSYERQYGKNFFENTKPVLVITNSTMNYTFEVDINDFANSWYLHINDANCDYKVELGRRFKTNSTYISDSDEYLPTTSYSANEYIYIASSNEIEVPNNHILFDKLGKSVFFRNVKTNFVEEKNIASLSYLQNIGRIYNIYDLYKKIYKNELISDEFELNLPSSNSSPTLKGDIK